MRHYRAYGLHIRSELDLPELAPGIPGSAIDVDISRGRVDGPLPEDEPRIVRFGPDGAYLAWPSIGRFHVLPDSRVTADLLTDDPQRARFALLGPVLAAALQLRGTPLLHGSAVASGNHAIALVGRKRAGKSTIAAALVAAGCRMLNDDVLPLVREGPSLMLLPGFSALKVEASIKQMLLPTLPTIGPANNDAGGKIVVSDATQTSGSLPIAAVIVLEPEAPCEPVRLSPAPAIHGLLQHGYALKFGQSALAQGQSEALFAACAHLAQSALILQVGRPANQSELPEFASRLLSACLPDYRLN